MVISVVLLKTEQSMAAQVCKYHLNKIKTYAVEKTVIQISSGRSHEQKKEMDFFNFSDKVTFVWNTRKSALVEKFLWQEKAVWYGTFFFFHDPTFPQRKFRWFSHVSRTQNLWAHFLDRRTDGKRWQGWPRLRRCMIR